VIGDPAVLFFSSLKRMIPDRWQVDCVLASMMRGAGAVPDEAFAYCPQETGTACCRKFAGDGRNTQVSIL